MLPIRLLLDISQGQKWCMFIVAEMEHIIFLILKRRVEEWVEFVWEGTRKGW